MAGVCFVNMIDGEDRYWARHLGPRHHGNDDQQQGKRQEVPPNRRGLRGLRPGERPGHGGELPGGNRPDARDSLESAIDGNSASFYEEVSRYLNDNTIFSVSDCSCRTAREAMGEGCGI
jgi:hypothetical protein